MIKDYELTSQTNTVTFRGGEKTIPFIMGMLGIIVVAWMNNGLFTFATPYVPNVVRYGVYFAWLGLALVSSHRYVARLISQTWSLLLFFFYIVLVSFLVGADLETYIKNIAYLIMVYSIFLYYFDDRYSQIQKLFCGFLILDFIVVGVNTYIKLQANPLLVRYLATSADTRKMLLGSEAFLGVGSYSYFYALVVIILLLGFLFFNQRRKKIFNLATAMAALFLLIQAKYTIAILFTLIFLALIIILRYTSKYTTTAIVILGIISLLIFQGAFANMFGQLANINGLPYEISVRFVEISHFLSGQDLSGTDLFARKNLYLQSIDAFTHNIFGGTVLSSSGVYRSGGHSAWLDLLANFGLFAIPFFVFLYKNYKYIRKRIPSKFCTFVKIYWLYFISLGFINTVLFAPIYIMWFLFIPFFIKINSKEKSLKSNGFVRGHI